eukprot:15481899-Alexandrium_andersonii.AAC.1
MEPAWCLINVEWPYRDRVLSEAAPCPRQLFMYAACVQRAQQRGVRCGRRSHGTAQKQSRRACAPPFPFEGARAQPNRAAQAPPGVPHGRPL